MIYWDKDGMIFDKLVRTHMQVLNALIGWRGERLISLQGFSLLIKWGKAFQCQVYGNCE